MAAADRHRRIIAVVFDRNEAELIVREHNRNDPIQSWNDWLEYRGGSVI